MMIHICAGKILVQQNIAPFDGYVYLVHIFNRRLSRHGTSKNYGNHLYVKTGEYARNEVCLTHDYIQLLCFTGISRGKLRRDPVLR